MDKPKEYDREALFKEYLTKKFLDENFLDMNRNKVKFLFKTTLAGEIPIPYTPHGIREAYAFLSKITRTTKLSVEADKTQPVLPRASGMGLFSHQVLGLSKGIQQEENQESRPVKPKKQ